MHPRHASSARSPYKGVSGLPAQDRTCLDDTTIRAHGLFSVQSDRFLISTSQILHLLDPSIEKAPKQDDHRRPHQARHCHARHQTQSADHCIHSIPIIFCPRRARLSDRFSKARAEAQDQLSKRPRLQHDFLAPAAPGRGIMDSETHLTRFWCRHPVEAYHQVRYVKPCAFVMPTLADDTPASNVCSCARIPVAPYRGNLNLLGERIGDGRSQTWLQLVQRAVLRVAY